MPCVTPSRRSFTGTMKHEITTTIDKQCCMNLPLRGSDSAHVSVFNLVHNVRRNCRKETARKRQNKEALCVIIINRMQHEHHLVERIPHMVKKSEVCSAARFQKGSKPEFLL